jgi:glycosyltransferase involved in cell wall biosynthesis
VKVLYIHQYFVEPTGTGGTRSYEFARRLVRDGDQVTMLTSTAFLGPERITSSGVCRFQIDGISVIALPIRYENSFGPARRILAFTRFALASVWHAARQERPDIIFATSTPLTVIVPALAARLRHRRPIVFEVRDLWPSIPIAMGYLKSGIARSTARGLERLAYRSARSIIALSPGMAAGVRQVRGSDTHVTVIPNSSDLELFGSADLKLEVPGWPDLGGRPTVTYAGTLGTANDISWLVEVACCLASDDDLAVVILGDGKDRETVEALARTRGVLGSRLFLLHPVSKLEMATVLARTTVALCLFADEPLLETTSPNKFFDALSAARPIAINYGGWQEQLLSEHRCGIRLSRDHTTAAHQLSRYVRAVDETDGAAAQTLARESFSREVLYQRLRSVLEDSLHA